MLQVSDQYFSDCDSFLGKICLDINWNTWLTFLVQNSNNYQTIYRVIHCLFDLLIKLTIKPPSHINDKVLKLLDNATKFNTWYLLDLNVLNNALDWYIKRCDPIVVIKDEYLGTKNIDYAILRLLRIVSFYDINLHTGRIDSDQIIKKRQCFMRAYIKLLINCSNKYKNLITTNPEKMRNTLKFHLNYLEKIIESVPKEHKKIESNILMQEFLIILNNKLLCKISLKAINEWMQTQNLKSSLLYSILQTAANVIKNNDTLSLILENAISSYFNDKTNKNEIPKWSKVIKLLNIDKIKQISLQNAIVENGGILTLYALLIKQKNNKNETELLLKAVVTWLQQIKIIDILESKIPLLWSEVIRLYLKLCYFGNQEQAVISLQNFVNNLLLTINNTEGYYYDRVELTYEEINISPHFQFLCKYLAAYILAKLPETKDNSGFIQTEALPHNYIKYRDVLLQLKSSGCSIELKPYVKTSLKQIRDPENTLDDVETYLFELVNVFYTKKYLKLNH